MNKYLRQLFTAVVALFVILGLSSTIIMAVRANALNNDPRNARSLYHQLGAYRGAILASDGTVMAKSEPVNDAFKYLRTYSNGPLYAPVTGFFSINQTADRGLEASRSMLLNGEADSLIWQRAKAMLTGTTNQGASIETSIDPKLQQVAYDQLGTRDGAAVAIAYQHVSEVATPPSAVVPGLPKMWDSICAKAMAKDRQNRYATASEFKTDILTYMNGGVPVAAAFNPLTDLSNMKARKEAERDLPTTPVEPQQQPTQAFNPVTGQFEQIPPANGANSAALQSRAQQRSAAAKAKKRKKIIIGSVIAAIVAVLVIVGIMFAMNGSGNKSSEDTVTIPEVCNASTSKDNIKLKLERLGLKMTEKQDTDSTEPEGTCTKMSPDAGSKVARGSAVKVWFSAGPQSTQVPDVKERSQEEARSILESAGFKVNATVKTEDSADIAKDMVTRTDPAAGQSVPKGTTITIYVSSGMTTVPSNLVGQSKDSVLQQYEGKFSFTVEQESSDTVEAGLITRVSPDSGSTANEW